jgi:uncharacterized protein YegL
VTDSSYTAICLLIDRSGSMGMIRRDAEGGVNAFLDDQRAADGRRTVRIDMFDDRFDTYCPTTDAAAVKPFELHPRGMTALLDAMARSIREFGAELAALDEAARPGHVIFAVMTDGEENSSREHSWDQVKAMVSEQQDSYGWKVVYLGANQDAIAVGGRLGVAVDSALTYAASGRGSRSMTTSLSGYVAVASAGGVAAFTDEQRDDASRT